MGWLHHFCRSWRCTRCRLVSCMCSPAICAIQEVFAHPRTATAGCFQALLAQHRPLPNPGIAGKSRVLDRGETLSRPVPVLYPRLHSRVPRLALSRPISRGHPRSSVRINHFATHAAERTSLVPPSVTGGIRIMLHNGSWHDERRRRRTVEKAPFRGQLGAALGALGFVRVGISRLILETGVTGTCRRFRRWSGCVPVLTRHRGAHTWQSTGTHLPSPLMLPPSTSGTRRIPNLGFDVGLQLSPKPYTSKSGHHVRRI
ncbi:hypothetical protein B0T11DRAFT_109780 [Plectosphaerella cucumerina]|uniref:Secreted protein n=1 Tax=Plectosphaerella cucumerina TaxID=40658 RepID=A0A8K0X2X7_9PEZI|nr:hypothetical protein B0T11DRAFT_109780 [Plectosphaerella cucumerina]